MADAPAADDAVRANAYSLLGALLAAPPGQELIELLRAITPRNGAEAGELAPSWEALRLAGDFATAATLDDEYHDLFIGMTRGELVPYGSWYLTGFMMDQPLAVLRQDLAALGYERQGDVREPEDHAGALLETMAMLIADGEDIDAQRRFFDRHVGTWMPTFFLDLQKANAAGFYRAVGQFGEHFMRFEKQYLSMLI